MADSASVLSSLLAGMGGAATPGLLGLANLSSSLSLAAALNPSLLGGINPSGLGLGANALSALLLQAGAAGAASSLLGLPPVGPSAAAPVPQLEVAALSQEQHQQQPQAGTAAPPLNEDADAAKHSDGGSGSKRAAASRRQAAKRQRSASAANLQLLEGGEDDNTIDAAGSLTALANLACSGSARSLAASGKRGSALSLSAMVPSSSGLDGLDSDDDVDGWEDKDVKRLRRKQSNRESARRSRLRKQAETEQLARDNSDMRSRLAAAEASVEPLRTLVQRLVAEREALMGQIVALGGKVEADPQLLLQAAAALGPSLSS